MCYRYYSILKVVAVLALSLLFGRGARAATFSLDTIAWEGEPKSKVLAFGGEIGSFTQLFMEYHWGVNVSLEAAIGLEAVSFKGVSDHLAGWDGDYTLLTHRFRLALKKYWEWGELFPRKIYLGAALSIKFGLPDLQISDHPRFRLLTREGALKGEVGVLLGYRHYLRSDLFLAVELNPYYALLYAKPRMGYGFNHKGWSYRWGLSAAFLF